MNETELRKTVLRVLQGHGSGNPLVRDIILEALHAQGFDVRERDLRDTLSHMVIDDKAPIGSATRGYFIITTSADLDEADKELKAKAESISIRRNCLLRNFKEATRPTTQGTLF